MPAKTGLKESLNTDDYQSSSNGSIYKKVIGTFVVGLLIGSITLSQLNNTSNTEVEGPFLDVQQLNSTSRLSLLPS